VQFGNFVLTRNVLPLQPAFFYESVYGELGNSTVGVIGATDPFGTIARLEYARLRGRSRYGAAKAQKRASC